MKKNSHLSSSIPQGPRGLVIDSSQWELLNGNSTLQTRKKKKKKKKKSKSKAIFSSIFAFIFAFIFPFPFYIHSFIMLRSPSSNSNAELEQTRRRLLKLTKIFGVSPPMAMITPKPHANEGQRKIKGSSLIAFAALFK